VKHVDGAVYLVDANTWVKLYEETYPPDVFPTLYTKLATLAPARLAAPTEVIRELGTSPNGAGSWVRTLNIARAPTKGTIGEAKRIVAEYPKLSTKGMAAGDPWIIATAMRDGCVVVTEEKFGSKDKPKIPFICVAKKVRWITGLEMLKELGVRVCAKCL
jgi:hypothetical protein